MSKCKTFEEWEAWYSQEFDRLIKECDQLQDAIFALQAENHRRRKARVAEQEAVLAKHQKAATK